MLPTAGAWPHPMAARAAGISAYLGSGAICGRYRPAFPLVIRCHFGAIKIGKMGAKQAFSVKSRSLNEKPANLVFMRIRGLLRVATLTGFEGVREASIYAVSRAH